MSRDYDEKRDFMRMCMDCPMSFTRQDGSRHEAMARDLSGSGAGFVTDQILAPGEILTIQLTPQQAVVLPLQAEVEVVRVDARVNGTYEVGVNIRRFV